MCYNVIPMEVSKSIRAMNTNCFCTYRVQLGAIYHYLIFYIACIESLEQPIDRSSLCSTRPKYARASLWDRRRPQPAHQCRKKRLLIVCICMRERADRSKPSSECEQLILNGNVNRGLGALWTVRRKPLLQRARSLPQVVHFYFNRRARVNSSHAHVTGAWRQESERDSNASLIKHAQCAPFASQRAKTDN